MLGVRFGGLKLVPFGLLSEQRVAFGARSAAICRRRSQAAGRSVALCLWALALGGLLYPDSRYPARSQGAVRARGVGAIGNLLVLELVLVLVLVLACWLGSGLLVSSVGARAGYSW